jgi:hypothetical protein
VLLSAVVVSKKFSRFCLLAAAVVRGDDSLVGEDSERGGRILTISFGEGADHLA